MPRAWSVSGRATYVFQHAHPSAHCTTPYVSWEEEMGKGEGEGGREEEEGGRAPAQGRAGGGGATVEASTSDAPA